MTTLEPTYVSYCCSYLLFLYVLECILHLHKKKPLKLFDRLLAMYPTFERSSGVSSHDCLGGIVLPNNGDVCRSRRHTSTGGLLLLA